MEDDFTFNIDDINLTEDSVNFLSENEETTKEVETKEDNNTTIESKETTDSVTDLSEKEENKETKENSSEETPSSETDSSQHSTLYALAKYLKDEGVLFIDELKEVNDLDGLKTLIKESQERARYQNMSESQKRYLESLENGVPIKEFETIEKEIETFQKIDEKSIEDNIQLRYELLAIDFINQGIEQEKAMKLAELAVKDETSTNDAKEALKNILDFKTNKYKELINTKKEQTELDLKDIKKAIDSKNTILEMPVNDITKNKLFDLMTTKVATDDNGMPLNKFDKFRKDNPIESNILMNYLFMMTNEGKDLGLIKTNTTSIATKELEQKLKNLNFDSSGSLIIPDEMISNNNKNSNKDTLTINIE